MNASLNQTKSFIINTGTRCKSLKRVTSLLGLISASLDLPATQLLSKKYRSGGDVSDLTGPRLEFRLPSSVTARLTGCQKSFVILAMYYFMPKRATSWGPIRPVLRHCACKNTAPYRRNITAVGNTVFDVICPRFEFQTSAPETNALPLDQLMG